MNKILFILFLVVLGGCKKEDAGALNDQKFNTEVTFSTHDKETRFQVVIGIYPDSTPHKISSYWFANTDGHPDPSNPAYLKWVDTGVRLPYTYKTNNKVDIYVDWMQAGPDTFFIKVVHNQITIQDTFYLRAHTPLTISAPK